MYGLNLLSENLSLSLSGENLGCSRSVLPMIPTFLNSGYLSLNPNQSFSKVIEFEKKLTEIWSKQNKLYYQQML